LLVEKLQGLIGHGFSLRFFSDHFYMVLSLAPPQNNNRPGRADNTCPILKSALLSKATVKACNCHVTSFD
jgi:hypothetical protein